MIKINLFIPPILTYDNWKDRYYRFKRKKLLNKTVYEKNNYLRTAFIQRSILKFGKNCQYLEIGCDKNEVFDTIPLDKEFKIGVDPNSGGTHRMTSDEFFKNNKKEFDVIFIDGLHTYEQVQKDIINSLKVLKKSGIILFHDFLPLDEISADPVRRLRGWNGDVWKVGVELSNSQGLILKIVNIDCGVGILKKSDNYKFNFMNLKNKSFDDFFNNYRNQMSIITSSEALKFIDEG